MITVMELLSEMDAMPLRAVRALDAADAVILQSGRIGSAKEIEERCKNVETLDGMFEEAEDFDALYRAGAEKICAASRTGEVVFGVIGDVSENGFLREIEKTEAPRYLGGGDPVAEALALARPLLGKIGEYRVADARGIGGKHIDTSLALAVRGVDDRFTAAEVKLALGEYYADDMPMALAVDGYAERIELSALDRIAGFGAGAVLIAPPLALTEKPRYGFYDLVEIMKRLRGKDGCPWDKEQTHKTLRQYLLEESYEVLDAVDADDMHALYDELGDVLLQVAFHAEIARQCGEFTDLDVTTAVCAKMIHRHPHIFGDAHADTADDVLSSWEQIKKKEKGITDFLSVLRDVPRTMGAMMRAYKLQKKAGAIGFDWNSAEEAFEKVREEMEELEEELSSPDPDAFEAEAGDLIFAVINVLRKKQINPEVALTRTCEKFVNRFAYMEEHAGGDLANLTLAEMDALWEKAKKSEGDF